MIAPLNPTADPYARQKRYAERKRRQRLSEGTIAPRMAERVPGPKSLLVAVVEQALIDYFILRRMGAVEFRHLTGKWKTRKNGGKTYQNMQPQDARELLQFIRNDVGAIFDAAGVDLPASLVWDGILSLEKSGRWRGMFGKGVGSFGCVASCREVAMVDA